MLKKFNLLFEEIMNEFQLNWRFQRFKNLSQNLSKKQKQQYNIQLDKLVLDYLKNALENNKDAMMYIRKDGWHNNLITDHAKIESIDKKDGDYVCTFYAGQYFHQLRQRKHNQQLYDKYGTGTKYSKEDWDKFNKENQEKYHFIDFPIKNLLTENAIEKVYQISREFSKPQDSSKLNLDNANKDVKFILNNNLMTENDLMHMLKWGSEKEYTKNIVLNNKNNTDEVLDKFKIKKDSKQYKEAEKDFDSSIQHKYYNGSNSIILQIKFKVNQGQPFDISRLNVIQFKNNFQNSQGQGAHDRD